MPTDPLRPYSLKDACMLLGGIDRKTLHEWAKQVSPPAEIAQDQTNRKRKLISRADLERIASFKGISLKEQPWRYRPMGERVSRLEDLMNELLESKEPSPALATRLRNLEESVATLVFATTERHPEIRTHLEPTQKELAYHADISGELASWRRFAHIHGIPETTVSRAIADRRLGVVEGHWKSGNAIIKQMLDQNGRTQFYRLWYQEARFLRCTGCPETPDKMHD